MSTCLRAQGGLAANYDQMDLGAAERVCLEIERFYQIDSFYQRRGGY